MTIRSIRSFFLSDKIERHLNTIRLWLLAKIHLEEVYNFFLCVRKVKADYKRSLTTPAASAKNDRYNWVGQDGQTRKELSEVKV